MSIKAIPEKYQIVFDLRRQGKTLEEIGIVINRSKQRVDQILNCYGGEKIHKENQRVKFLDSIKKHHWNVNNIDADGVAELVCSLCNFSKKKVSSYCIVNRGCILCSYTKRKDTEIIGLRFNSWTVIGRGAKMGDGKNYKWTCVCDCGTISDVELRNLRNGLSRQCRHCGYKNRW